MKLHPLSVPYRAVRTVLNLGGIAIVVLLVLPSVLQSALGVAIAGAVVITGLVGILAWQYAYYQRFEYVLTESTFDIDSGVLSRRSREIPYERIQNVSIDRNVLERALGLSEVRLETAGGSGAEAHLQYVRAAEADRLQDEVGERARRSREETGRTGRRTAEEGAPADEAGPAPDAVRDEAAGRPAAAGTGAAGPQRERLFELTGRELTVLGLVSLDARYLPFVLFALGALPGSVDLEGEGGALALLAIAGAILVFTLLAAGVSAAFSVANYYGFQLDRLGEELRYERGLLQRYSGTIPLEKVQALTVTENPLARWVGYASLTVETAGFSPGQSGGSQAAVPIARRERVLELATEIEPTEIPAFETPPKRARTRYVARYTIIVALGVATAFAASSAGFWIGPWWSPAVAMVLVPIAAQLKWRNIGYALTDDHVITRHGFWSRSTKIVPYHRVQTVADSQTIFQRRRRLATVHVDVAGSQSLVRDDSRIVDIDRERADDLRETITERLLAAVAERANRPEDRLVEPPVGRDAEPTDRGPFGGPPSPTGGSE